MPKLLLLPSLDLLPGKLKIWDWAKKGVIRAEIFAFPAAPWVPVTVHVRREERTHMTIW